MSINVKQTVACPKCGEQQELTLWNSITANDSQDLVADLLEGRINILDCQSCGARALVPVPLLYTDPELKLMISFLPERDAEKAAQHFESVKKTSRESGELEDYKDFNLRFVSEYNALLEKLLIFRAGLHDKVVELVKLMVLMQEPDKMEQRSVIFGKADSEGLEFMVQNNDDKALFTCRVPNSTYETVKSSVAASGVKFVSYDWEVVDLEYAQKMLYGVNN